MSFDSRERSLRGGQPVRLYEFSRGTLFWRYTTADRDIVSQLRKFESVSISDDGIRQTGEASADRLVITAPSDLAVARLYRAAPPSVEIGLTIYDAHYGDADAVVSWVGSVSHVKWPRQDRSQISCESLPASLDKPGLRLAWERNCPHSLGDRLCGVDLEQFKTAGTIAGVGGAGIAVPAAGGLPAGYLSGGFIAWEISGGETERRGIETHSVITLTLIGGTAGLVAGQPLRLYPGCPRTIQACHDRFGNELNYGGIWHLPGRSPFDGNPIF